MHEDEYTLIEDIDAPGKDDAGHHLVDYETGKLISNLWSIYLAKAREGIEESGLAAVRISRQRDGERVCRGNVVRRGLTTGGHEEEMLKDEC